MTITQQQLDEITTLCEARVKESGDRAWFTLPAITIIELCKLASRPIKPDAQNYPNTPYDYGCGFQVPPFTVIDADEPVSIHTLIADSSNGS